jgi:hypothetical protein
MRRHGLAIAARNERAGLRSLIATVALIVGWMDLAHGSVI